jgi:hypothetical protein
MTRIVRLPKTRCRHAGSKERRAQARSITRNPHPPRLWRQRGLGPRFAYGGKMKEMAAMLFCIGRMTAVP